MGGIASGRMSSALKSQHSQHSEMFDRNYYVSFAQSLVDEGA